MEERERESGGGREAAAGRADWARGGGAGAGVVAEEGLEDGDKVLEINHVEKRAERSKRKPLRSNIPLLWHSRTAAHTHTHKAKVCGVISLSGAVCVYRCVSMCACV